MADLKQYCLVFNRISGKLVKQGLLSIVKQGLKFLKGLVNQEVIKRIAKIIRVDVTNP